MDIFAIAVASLAGCALVACVYVAAMLARVERGLERVEGVADDARREVLKLEMQAWGGFALVLALVLFLAALAAILNH